MSTGILKNRRFMLMAIAAVIGIAAAAWFGYQNNELLSQLVKRGTGLAG